MSDIKKPVPPQGTPPIKFKFSDGSTLYSGSARMLASFPIWDGNRILDEIHRDAIQKEIGENIKALDLKPYHTVTYETENEEGKKDFKTVIIDGQHRASILKHYFYSPEVKPIQDFQILIVDKRCQSEDEVIDYFKILNHVKSVPWEEDPNMKANKYISALSKALNKGKKPLLKSNTHRPFLSTERLREALVKRKFVHLTPETFVERVQAINTEIIRALENRSDLKTVEKRALEYKFGLALDEKCKWLDSLLSTESRQ
jgi:hypothetical protein